MKKVLIVEDNPLNMELVIEILLSRGFTADGVATGEEALKSVDGNNYDLVLMDIELPGINGIETTRKIKSGKKNLPIIALTSFAMKGDRERFLSAGFDDYLSKPIDIIELINKINIYIVL